MAWPRRAGMVAVWALALGGCGLGGKSGIDPAVDRIFYPAGLAVDGSSRFLYVVNSNSDLRFNDGTLAVVDLERAAAARARGDWPSCPPPGKAPNWSGGEVACCRDALDGRVLNCDERPFVRKEATVRIGSFGGAVVVHPYTASDGTSVERLYVAVRAEPSITVVDATPGATEVSLRCTGARPGAPGTAPEAGNPLCTDAWKVRTGARDATLALPEEPYALALDAKLGSLYVGHLLGGQVSLIDVCRPDNSQWPRFLGFNRSLFQPDSAGRMSVTSLQIQGAGTADTRVYATSRYAAAVASFVLRGAGEDECDGASDAPADRDMAIVGSSSFVSSVYAPGGADLRGMVFSADGGTVYLLHRSPASIVVMDVRPDEEGHPRNRPVANVDVCGGPSSLRTFDAGRGMRLLVTCFEGGQMAIVDPVTATLEAVVDAGRGPAAVAFPAADRTIAYVAGFSDNDVGVLDLRPGSPTEYTIVQRLGFPSAVPRR